MSGCVEHMALFIPGEPVAKARPRVMRNGHAYTPKKTEDAERNIRAAWIGKYGDRPADHPVEMRIEFVYEIPKSWSKKKKMWASTGVISKTSRPDIDNLVKTVMDALNGIAYVDDSLIRRVEASKRYKREHELNEGTYLVLSVCGDVKEEQ